jgi:hypothetical protein
METELCGVCHHDRQWHRENPSVQHAFSENGQLSKKPVDSKPVNHASSGDPATQGSIGRRLQGDPILRLLLIRKGIITTEELTQVEDELQGAGFAWASPPVG